MRLEVEVQVACRDKLIIHPSQIKKWAAMAYEEVQNSEVIIRIVDKQEITHLNKLYRKKDKPTNVLAFPVDMDEIGFESTVVPLGDIIICNEVVKEEAMSQDKSFLAHFAHMVIHGMLHLQSYDHVQEEEAAVMEEREVELLTELGIRNPYEEKIYVNT